MAIRLIEMRRILKKTGSIYLHCDPTMSHYLKLMMDATFGARQFRNEIVWCYRGGGVPKLDFARKHDILLRYSKTVQRTFNVDDVRTAYSDESSERLKYKAKAFRDNKIYDNYEKNPKGKHPEDWWSLQPIMPSSGERLGYPTQKPLALLDRIIKASSHPGDMVLDPFCGCATTCVAAERLGRQWVGIDIEPKARDLVVSRLQEQADEGALFKNAVLPNIHHLKRSPKRTDADAPQRSKNIKLVLYGRQKGRCAGNCGPDGKGRTLDLDLFEVDHIAPRSKGGEDVDSNLQLLCTTCNRRKGSRTMKYLIGF